VGLHLGYMYRRVVRAGDVVMAERLRHILVNCATVSTKYRMIFVQNVRRKTCNQMVELD